MDAEAGNGIAQAYIDAFVREGSRAFIANLDTTVVARRWGEYLLPMTINHGEKAETFVCSPKVGYIDYPREELSRFPNRALVPALRAIIGAMGGLLTLTDLDRIVHINNWMMSSNHPLALDPSLARSQTEELTHLYPKHILAMRSLTRRYNTELIEALLSAGWVLLPSRQIFLVDDVPRECSPRRDTKRDAALWERGAFSYVESSDVSEADAARIVEIYNLLYLDKYSRLNPHYTARFVDMTQRIGMIRYLILRDAEGVIQGFGGMYTSHGHATMPLIGYDTRMAREHGLYRLVFHAGLRFAASRGLHFNMSSGATSFKRSRGATAEMEFTAFHVRHLPRWRGLPFAALQWVAEHVGMPILRKYDL